MKNVFFASLLIVLCSMPQVSYAKPQLTASVNAVQVGVQEVFTLTVTLSGLAQRSFSNSQTPDVAPLATDFHILSRQQQYSLLNGTLEMRWEYELQAKRVGNKQIPSLALQIAQQTLQTQPISISVQQNPQASNEYRLEALVSTQTPYLQQPFIYTLQLYHNGKIKVTENVTIPKEGVIVEQLGQWQSRQEVVNGQPAIVTAINYLMTPLRSGHLALDPAQVVVGEPIQHSRHRSLFSFGGANYRPTTIVSETIDLEVRSAPNHVPIWLPLAGLQLSEDWETEINQAVPVGVPLIRTITLNAVNMGAQALPDLTTFFADTSALRVNQPKPDTQRQLLPDGKTPVTTMTQSFSITPLQTGAVQIPAVKIPWWNVQSDKLVWAELPAQMINVIPNPTLSPFNPATSPSDAVEPSIAANTLIITEPRLSAVQYLALNVALLALCFALIYVRWGRWQLNTTRNTQQPEHEKSLRATQFKQRLAELNDLTEIKALLQQYAHHRWKLPPQTGLNQIITYLSYHYEGTDKLGVVFKELETALYSSHAEPLNLSSWKTRCAQFLLNLSPKSSAIASKLSASPTTLNPV